MDCCTDEDDPATCAGLTRCLAIGFVLLGRSGKSGKSSLESIEAAEDINIDDGFESVGTELINGGEEISRCSSAAYPSVTCTRLYDRPECSNTWKDVKRT